MQVWGYAKKSNIDIIQYFHNKVQRNIVDAPWFIKNNKVFKEE